MHNLPFKPFTTRLNKGAQKVKSCNGNNSKVKVNELNKFTFHRKFINDCVPE